MNQKHDFSQNQQLFSSDSEQTAQLYNKKYKIYLSTSKFHKKKTKTGKKNGWESQFALMYMMHESLIQTCVITPQHNFTGCLTLEVKLQQQGSNLCQQRHHTFVVYHREFFLKKERKENTKTSPRILSTDAPTSFDMEMKLLI